LDKFIKIRKNELPTLFYSNVVYKINCKDCDVSLVCQTSKLLKRRLNK